MLSREIKVKLAVPWEHIPQGPLRSAVAAPAMQGMSGSATGLLGGGGVGALLGGLGGALLGSTAPKGERKRMAIRQGLLGALALGGLGAGVGSVLGSGVGASRGTTGLLQYLGSSGHLR